MGFVKGKGGNTTTEYCVKFGVIKLTQNCRVTFFKLHLSLDG